MLFVSCVAAGADQAPAQAQTPPNSTCGWQKLLARIFFFPFMVRWAKASSGVRDSDVVTKVTLGPDQTLAALLNGDADIASGRARHGYQLGNQCAWRKGQNHRRHFTLRGLVSGGAKKIAPDQFHWESLQGQVVNGLACWHVPGGFRRKRSAQSTHQSGRRPDLPTQRSLSGADAAMAATTFRLCHVLSCRCRSARKGKGRLCGRADGRGGRSQRVCRFSGNCPLHTIPW